MLFNFVEVKDNTVVEYPVAFPVTKDNIAVFINGKKLLNTGFTFQQSSNSVLINCPIEVGDIIQFRLIRGA